MSETQEKGKSYVESLRLADELEKRVALASVRIGDVLIHGVTVWQSGRGRIRVYFPSYKQGYRWDEAIELSQDLRTEIEADVISATRRRNKKPRKLRRNAMEVKLNSCLPHPEAVQMERGDTVNRLVDSRKLSQTWTVFSENTIRELAVCGNIPVAAWVNGEPVFVYDHKTAGAFLRLFRGPYAR